MYKTIRAQWNESDLGSFTVDVFVGDGSEEFDEDYEYDQRVFFYFVDEAEFEKAKTGLGFEFKILEVIE